MNLSFTWIIVFEQLLELLELALALLSYDRTMLDAQTRLSWEHTIIP